jgi:REP element-mobilizing transposase RayT
MGQSLVRNYLHLVFSTKHRQPFIRPPVEEELHAYLGGVCKSFGCAPIKVGGYVYHVHILITLSQKIALMKLVERVKANSSRWIKTKGGLYQNFFWQDGYGAFSVSEKAVDRVSQYIEWE